MARLPDTLIAVVCATLLLASATAVAGPGVLVVAKDRGAVGNQELEAAVDALDPDYPVELLLVGPDRQGVENGYAGYIAAARRGLQAAGADSIIAIPLFVTGHEAVLARFRPRIERAMAPMAVEWTPALADSYLAREILGDRLRQSGADGARQRLLLLLQGAHDAESAGAMREIGQRLLADMAHTAALNDMEVAVRYSESAPKAAAAQADEAIEATLERLAAQGETVLVPMAIDTKFTPHMSLEMELMRRFGRDRVTLTDSAMPHPAIRTWLKRMINAHVAVRDEHVGFLIMPHGSSAPYNDGIIAAMPDIVEDYLTAFAFGMASPMTIRQAVRKLEAEGVRHAVFLRLFAREDTFRDPADYIVGLRPEPPAHGHGGTPERVRTPIRFISTGGYQPDPLIAEILTDRILEVSRNPAEESVLLLSHGTRSDRSNAAALAVVEDNIADMKAALDEPFRAIRAINLREDWPDKRAEALREINAYIKEANRHGRAIVISNRLYGSGSYAEYLDGLDYVMNGQGLIPHPNFTRWVARTLEDALEQLKSGTAPTSTASQTARRPVDQ